MNSKYKYIKRIILFTVLTFFLQAAPLYAMANNYQGTDDLIDAKMRQTAGVGAKAPLIDISKGNIGLFVFAVGGFAAGTIVGYYWRKIFNEKAGNENA